MGTKTSGIISRDEAHRTGVWHGAFHCLIISSRDGRGKVLLQKRSVNKKIAPGKFDVSVGGHYASGEDADVAGPREITEELGLSVRFSDLVPIGRRIFIYCVAPDIKEYEFQDVFLLPRNILTEQLALQQEELDGVIELDLEQGIALFSGKTHQVEVSMLTSGGQREIIRISAGDFVPCVDNYYLKLLLLAQRYMNGEQDLLLI
jgi:isopentenyldiphosphate isomerase